MKHGRGGPGGQLSARLRGGGSSFSREEVSGRGQWRQTPGDVGQQGEVGEALDVGLELLSYLCHPCKFLLVLLQGTEEHGMTSPVSANHRFTIESDLSSSPMLEPLSERASEDIRG